MGKRTLLTRSIALGPALVVAMRTNETDMDTINEWLNVQQSVQLPFALLPLLVLNCSKRVMGEFALGWGIRMLCYGISGLVMTINLYLIIDQLTQIAGSGTGVIVGLVFFCLIYVGFCIWIVVARWNRGPVDETAVNLLSDNK